MSRSSGQTYTINGIKVQFPHKAYPSQIAMMDKIIKGLERRQNCLLESPTGSGKSLALLCSALAWQRHEAERIKMEEKEGADKEVCCTCTCGNVEKSDSGEGTSTYFSATASNNQVVPVPSLGQPQNVIDLCDDEDNDFKSENKKFRTPAGGGAKTRPCVSPVPDIEDVGTAPSWKMELKAPSEGYTPCVCGAADYKPKQRVPKIFFGTRTHKQIAQITRELRKTIYSATRMTILSSREHSCIHPEISTMSNKNEECKNLMDGPGCRFFDNVRRKVSHASMKLNNITGAWDLEDFKGFCKKAKACSYFGGRQLKTDADIVFCPYNYLIEPNIRESLEIYLKDQIVIIDEAHNIEDSSRDAASYTLAHHDITDTIEDLNKMIGASKKVNEHRPLRDVMTGFHTLIENHRESTVGDNFDTAYKMWTGMEMVAQLKMCGVTEDGFPILTKCFAEVSQDDSEEEGKQKDPLAVKLKSNTTRVLGSLLTVLGFIFKNNMKYMNDYRIALVKAMTYINVSTEGRWLNKKRRGHRQVDWSFSVNFWCLNPAVAFTDLGADCRSVVLTSGTLSPMNSFQSELDIPFPIQLEASHVIGKSQVWVGTISKGPRGCQLLGTYQNSETFAYQDDVGEVLLEVCRTVPHGVLCFVSSYKTIEKLTNRWKNTGLYERMQEHKVVMTEPKASEKVNFDELIREYYQTIEDYEDSEVGEEVTGALFIAVCRGKVSEGLDFADNNARAVITVGIPFPHIKDPQIDLKKQYNNQHSMNRGLLKGGEWYEIQAYRALNQALGRCIRHRNDWGALILVDERFAKCPQRYTKGLSKWVRQKVQYFHAFPAAQQSLARFTQERLAEPTTNDVSVINQTSVTPSTPIASTSAEPEFKTPYLTKHNIHQTSTPVAHTNSIPPVVSVSHTPSLTSEHINHNGYIQSIGDEQKSHDVPLQVLVSKQDSHSDIPLKDATNEQGSHNVSLINIINNPMSHNVLVQQTASPVLERKMSSVNQTGCLVTNSSLVNQHVSVPIGGKSFLTRPCGNFPAYIEQFDTASAGQQSGRNQMTQLTQSEFGSKSVICGNKESEVDSMEGVIDINEDEMDFNPVAASTQISLSSQRNRKNKLTKVKTGSTNKRKSDIMMWLEPAEKIVKTTDRNVNNHGDLPLHGDLRTEGETHSRVKLQREKVQDNVVTRVKGKLMKYNYNEEKSTPKQVINTNSIVDNHLKSVEIIQHKQNVKKSPPKKNSLFEFVNLQDNCKQKPADDGSLNRPDSRMSSPDLFGSDNELMSCDNDLDDAIKNMCTDVKLMEDVDKLEREIVIEKTKNDCLMVKPLFKQSRSKDIKAESDTVENMRSSSTSKKDSVEVKCELTVENSGDSKLGAPSKVQENVNTEPAEDTDKTLEETLMTRRGSRMKRRRLIGGNMSSNKKSKSKGVDFNDSIDTSSGYRVHCVDCHKALMYGVKAFSPATTLPADLKQLANTRKILLIQPDNISESNKKKIVYKDIVSDEGIPFNSYYSDVDGCCYRCIICDCNDKTLGLEVKCLSQRHHRSLRLGQVWLFKDASELIPVD